MYGKMNIWNVSFVKRLLISIVSSSWRVLYWKVLYCMCNRSHMVHNEPPNGMYTDRCWHLNHLLKDHYNKIVSIIIYTFHKFLFSHNIVMVALGNKEVRIYKDRYLVNKIIMDVSILQMIYNTLCTVYMYIIKTLLLYYTVLTL